MKVPAPIREAVHWLLLIPLMCLFTSIIGLVKGLFEDWGVLGNASVSLAASFAWMISAFYLAPRSPRVVGAVALGVVFLVIGGLTLMSVLMGLGVLPHEGGWERQNTLDLAQGIAWMVGATLAYTKLRGDPEFAPRVTSTSRS